MPPDERLCAVCHGLGYIIGPHADSTRAIACPANCDINENRKMLAANSNVSPHMKTATLREALFPAAIQPAVQELLATVYGENVGGFQLIHGPNGTGKTYLLAATINEAIRNQRSAYYTTALDIINDLRRAVMDKNDRLAESNLIKRIQDVTVLCVDELGRERQTEYAVEKMFQILNARYEAAHTHLQTAHPKLTLLASNYPPDEMEPYLHSRLTGLNSRIISLEGQKDRRQQRDV